VTIEFPTTSNKDISWWMSALHYFSFSCCRRTSLSFTCNNIGSSRAYINQETHIMRSTVVKRDTASRKRYGSSRAEINAETIMWRSTVENKDKMEPIMSHSTVVKRDTASRERHGSSRAEINLEMNMKHSTLVEDDASMLYIGNEVMRGSITATKIYVSNAMNVQVTHVKGARGMYVPFAVKQRGASKWLGGARGVSRN
jgi:hypothetical protein